MKDKPAKKIFGKPLPMPWKPPVPALGPPKAENFPVKGSFPRKMFEPIMFQAIALDKLSAELVIHLHDADGDREVKTCVGDIYKIVNALMDYSRLLELVCDEWDLQGLADQKRLLKQMDKLTEGGLCGFGCYHGRHEGHSGRMDRGA